MLLERSATLQPDLASAGAARRILHEALAAAGREEWLDDGALAVSEIVANAALHAHTPINVLVQVRRDRLRVEVRDFNPRLPILRGYDDHASTGRGMGLIAALTTECGVRSLGAEGKVVWFSMGGAVPERTQEQLLAAWELDPDLLVAQGEHQVLLPSMPATLWLSARQHHDALLRELVFYLSQHDDVEADLTAADRARRLVSDALVQAVEEAARTGTARPALPRGHPSPLPWVPAHLDLAVSVPAGCAPDFDKLQDALDVGQRLAIDGKLLVRPALPEIVAVRDWACEQVVAQLGGTAPAPWPGAAQERFETEVNDRAASVGPAWDPAEVRESDRRVVAADEANRLIAVSRPLADLLGWVVDDLVGRRVVTLIPPSLREAHVAGYTRHLTTGEAHVLGVPLHLPVLHSDGTEIPCRFMVESAWTHAGRTVYLAWIDPEDQAGAEALP